MLVTTLLILTCHKGEALGANDKICASVRFCLLVDPRYPLWTRKLSKARIDTTHRYCILKPWLSLANLLALHCRLVCPKMSQRSKTATNSLASYYLLLISCSHPSVLQGRSMFDGHAWHATKPHGNLQRHPHASCHTVLSLIVVIDFCPHNGWLPGDAKSETQELSSKVGVVTSLLFAISEADWCYQPLKNFLIAAVPSLRLRTLVDL